MKRLLLLLLLLVCFTTCSDDQFPSDATLPIITPSLIDVDGSSITIGGTVVFRPEQAADTAYLIWHPDFGAWPVESDRYKIPVPLPEAGPISATVDRDVIPGLTYNFRWMIELADGRRYFSRVVRQNFDGPTRQPLTNQFTFSRDLTRDISSFAVNNQLLEFRRNNNRITQTPQGFVITTDPERTDRATRFLFDRPNKNRFWTDYQDGSLYLREYEQSSDSLTVWRHQNGEATVTNLGVLEQPPFDHVCLAADQNVYFFDQNRELYRMRQLETLAPELLGGAPYTTDGLINSHFSYLNGKIYLLLVKLENPEFPSSPRLLELYAYDIESQQWTELPPPPAAFSYGEKMLSAGDDYLLYGGSAVPSDRPGSRSLVLARIYWLDFEDNKWRMLTWWPHREQIEWACPVFADDKHHLLFKTLTPSGRETTTYYTLDLKLLQPL